MVNLAMRPLGDVEDGEKIKAISLRFLLILQGFSKINRTVSIFQSLGNFYHMSYVSHASPVSPVFVSDGSSVVSS